MANERIEDVAKFGTIRERVVAYGQNLQERLQAQYPQRRFTGKVSHVPGFGYAGDREAYLIQEGNTEVPRRWIGRFLGPTKTVPRTLIRLSIRGNLGVDWVNENSFEAEIIDPSLRDSAGKIMAELDQKSGQHYSKRTTWASC